MRFKLGALIAMCCVGVRAARADAPWTASELPGQERLHWKPSVFTTSLHVAASLTIVADILFTIDSQHQKVPYNEQNPILGKHPNDTALVLYGVGALTVTTAAWLALPDEIRPLLDLITIGVQFPLLEMHLGYGLTMRLPFK